MSWRVIQADVLDGLAQLEDQSVQTCVTSPPYYGLRDYGDPGQIGLESTVDEYVDRMIEVFGEVWRVLRDDGTLWLNLGDSYCSTDKWGGGVGGNTGKHTVNDGDVPSWAVRERSQPIPGVKPKDLLGIPWMVAFALRADGWYLRSDIIWAKPNPMPESVTDRPTKAHEYLFLLSKSRSYFYDADAIRETAEVHSRPEGIIKAGGEYEVLADRSDGDWPRSTTRGFGADAAGRNKRSVWEVATAPFPGAHFAVFPPKLIEPCVLAGSSPQACAECGAPWRRVVERVVPTDPGRGESKLRDAEGLSHRAASTAKRQLGGNYQKQLNENPPRTVGWEPSCEHDDGSGRSVVLDPFSGAGTTGVVACRHDRDFIGIELNPEYAEMSRQRIRDDGPLLNVPSELVA